MKYKYPVYKPYLPKSVRDFAHDAIDSSWISSTGKYIEFATDLLKEKMKVKHVLLTNNGTSAMHLIAKTLREFNKEVRTIIVPNNVYIAAWNAFKFDGYFNLRHTDTDLATWNMDMKSFNALKHTAQACLIVHNLGNIVNVPKLKKDYPTLIFIEDACEAFGGSYEEMPAGSVSFASALSFYGNKNITSGEGGAFLTNQDEVYDYAYKLHGQGQSDRKFIHDILGYNYRMTNIQAAFLYGQLLISDRILRMKDEVFYTYVKNTLSIDNLEYQISSQGVNPSHWMIGIRLVGNKNYGNAKKFFDSKGIETRPFFYSINNHQHFRSHWGDMDNAKLLQKEVIVFPSYPELTKLDILMITDEIKKYVKTI